MRYRKIITGIFHSRPNRFIAWVEVEGREEKCHVKNTGRLGELLEPGVVVYLSEADNPDRKTRYDMVAVQQGERIVNIDSQAPNQAAGEWLAGGGLYPEYTLLKPEQKIGRSRIDFYMETKDCKAFVEVKGVTLRWGTTSSFPDAPSERAVKHLQELIELHRQGYEAWVLFVVQMKGITRFVPNRKMHREFADALTEAAEAGVHLIAYDCLNTPDSMVIDQPVKVEIVR